MYKYTIKLFMIY